MTKSNSAYHTPRRPIYILNSVIYRPTPLPRASEPANVEKSVRLQFFPSSRSLALHFSAKNEKNRVSKHKTTPLAPPDYWPTPFPNPARFEKLRRTPCNSHHPHPTPQSPAPAPDVSLSKANNASPAAAPAPDRG